MKLFANIREIAKIFWREDGFEIGLDANTSTTYTADRNNQLPPGDQDGVLVGETNTQTLTNKTLTAPVINSPTGITKADVGLGNVDNTSDATKNAAAVTLTNKTLDSSDTLTGARMASFTPDGVQTLTAPVATDTLVGRNTTDTLTNKTLTAPVINSPTGITKADVGLGNVDNTSDATKNAAVATLTNKTLQQDLIDDFLEFNEETTPSTPSAGKLRIYPKSDHNMYKLDSNGVESQIGSGTGSGEINYISNPSAASAITGWSASGAGVTVARTTTAADLPRASLTPSGIRITPVSGTTDYAYTRFTMGAADKQKQLKIQFAMHAMSGYAAGDLVLEMHTNTASNYAGTDNSLLLRMDSIPNQDGVFTTTFQSDNSDYYELRIRRAAGTSAVVLADVIVGPGSTNSVPAIQDEVTYVPTYHADWDATDTGTRYSRVGSLLKVRGTFNAGTTGAGSSTISLPPGLTVGTLVGGRIVGQLWDNVAADNTRILIANNGNTFVEMGRAYAGGSIFTAIAPNNIGSNFEAAFEFTVPVLEWANSSLLVVETIQEYASNNSTADNDDHVSFVQGPYGSQFPPLTSAHDRWVHFNSPILPSDVIVVQLSDDGGTNWRDIGAANAIVDKYSIVAAVQQYGVGVGAIIDSHTCNILFGSYARNNAATYGGAGQAWSAVSGTDTNRWRAVKYTSPVSVGLDLADTAKAGLVSEVDQNLSGIKNFEDGVKLSGGSTLETYTDWADYTPALVYAGNAAVATISITEAKWMRIGNQVTVSLAVTITNPNGGSGLLTVSMPVPEASGAVFAGSGGISDGTLYWPATLNFAFNQSAPSIRQTRDTGGVPGPLANADASAYGAGTVLQMVVTYRV